MNPTVHAHKRPLARDSYYVLTFETLADRTRWLIKHNFQFAPLEHSYARWFSWHNGSDFSHSLEVVPYAVEHACNPMSLTLKVYLHSNNKPPSAPLRRGQKGFLKSPEAGFEND